MIPLLAHDRGRGIVTYHENVSVFHAMPYAVCLPAGRQALCYFLSEGGRV
jgi:hypothetical protein